MPVGSGSRPFGIQFDFPDVASFGRALNDRAAGFNVKSFQGQGFRTSTGGRPGGFQVRPSSGQGFRTGRFGGNSFQVKPFGNTGFGVNNFNGTPFQVHRTAKPEDEAAGNQPVQGVDASGNGIGATGIDPQTDRWRAIIDEAVAGSGIDGDILQALMILESQGVPTARNPDADARGLLQLLPENFSPEELKNWADPKTNITVGVRLMKQKIASIQAMYARLGINRTGRDFAIDVAKSWLGGLDWNTGRSSTAKDANGMDGEKYGAKFAAVYDMIKRNRASQPTAPGKGGTYSGTTTGMNSIWGDTAAPISQEFGVVDPGVDQGIYTYGKEFCLNQGHTGLDIGVRKGTAIYMPKGGGCGTVTIAGKGPGGYFYREESGQFSPDKSGELRVRLDNGNEIIFGHMAGFTTAVGSKICAGQQVGTSGYAAGDHLHLEYRIPSKQCSSGWAIVDPRGYIK